jgi:hypothetical protein
MKIKQTYSRKVKSKKVKFQWTIKKKTNKTFKKKKIKTKRKKQTKKGAKEIEKDILI